MDFPQDPGIGLVDGRFVDENAATGSPGSTIPASWGNGLTDEMLNVIRAAGLTPDENNVTQLLAAIRTLTTGRLLAVRYFTTVGTTPYTPTPGTTTIEVELCGGGGGGGGCVLVEGGQAAVGGSGHGGGYARKRITSGFSGATITVGAGGTAGAVGANNGGNGGTSSFGTLVTASGGAGGSGGVAAGAFPTLSLTGGEAGAASGGDLNSKGFPATASVSYNASNAVSGVGGGSPFGGGATSANSQSPAGGISAVTYGAGASGAAADAVNAAAKSGGTGGQGVVIIREYY